MFKQNASLVEESSAASMNMKEHAEKMNSLMAFFSLNEDTALTANSDIAIAETQNGNHIGGTFDLTYGSNTATVNHDATDSQLETILENSLVTKNVDVTRSGPDTNNGYSWTISFLEEEGDVSMLTANVTSLTGVGKASSIVEVHKGTFKVF